MASPAKSASFFDIVSAACGKYCVNSFAVSHSLVFCGTLFSNSDRRANSSSALMCKHRGVLEPDCLFSILPGIFLAKATSLSDIFSGAYGKYCLNSSAVNHSSVFFGIFSSVARSVSIRFRSSSVSVDVMISYGFTVSWLPRVCGRCLPCVMPSLKFFGNNTIPPAMSLNKTCFACRAVCSAVSLVSLSCFLKIVSITNAILCGSDSFRRIARPAACSARTAERVG